MDKLEGALEKVAILAEALPYTKNFMVKPLSLNMAVMP